MIGGTGIGARLPERNQAGKTGTIEDNRAVWFNAFTPEIAGTAMIAVGEQPQIWDSGYRKRPGCQGLQVPSTGFLLRAQAVGTPAPGFGGPP